MAAGLIRPNTAFDASLQPDGSIRVVELVEKKTKVPVVKVKRNKDGTYSCPLRLTRDEIRAAIRADRDRL